MKPRIETIADRTCVGLFMKMTLIENTTAELWRSFMPRKGEVKNAIESHLISLQEFDDDYFEKFSAMKPFTKWALVEVTRLTEAPSGMKPYIIKGGMYAVFDYKGMPGDPSIFQYIYLEWLPASLYELDHRPHFEILAEKYKNGDINSEEEIWIPVQPKQ